MDIKKNQEGFVAIFVCIVIMLIIGILVLSFGTISNREVRIATNRELSTQALYASESGINDAYSIISYSGLKQQTTSCTTDLAGRNYYYSATNSKLSSNPNVNEQYNCVFVNGNNLTSLIYDCSIPGVCPDDSLVSLLQSSSNTPINNFTIEWADSTTNNSSCTNLSSGILPIYKVWPTCLPELLRVDIVAINNNTTTVDNLLTDDYGDARTFFIQPTLNGHGSSSAPFQSLPRFNQTNPGTFILPSYCTETNSPTIPSPTNTNCSFTVNGLPGSSSTKYYLRIQYYYNPSQGNFSLSYPKITLCANGCNPQNPLPFANSQVQIDVNGYAKGVEVRTDSRISLLSSVSGSASKLPLPPNYALQSYHSICKSLIIDGSSLYEEMPSNTEGGFPSDLTSSPNTQTQPQQISAVSPTDFCNPIGSY
jgi:Tfp pilus assembly protein PilX